jgi:glutaredoxin 3
VSNGARAADEGRAHGLRFCTVDSKSTAVGGRFWRLIVDRVQVYGTGWCPYCVAATRLLDTRGIAYTEVKLDPSVMRETVWEIGQQRTIPLIVIDGKPIGGFQELAALDRAGRLNELVGERAA